MLYHCLEKGAEDTCAVLCCRVRSRLVQLTLMQRCCLLSLQVGKRLRLQQNTCLWDLPDLLGRYQSAALVTDAQPMQCQRQHLAVSQSPKVFPVVFCRELARTRRRARASLPWVDERCSGPGRLPLSWPLRARALAHAGVDQQYGSLHM